MSDSALFRMIPGDSVTMVDKNGITLTVHRKTKTTEFVATVPADTVKIDTSFIVKPVNYVKSPKEHLLRMRIVVLSLIIVVILLILGLIRKYIGK